MIHGTDEAEEALRSSSCIWWSREMVTKAQITETVIEKTKSISPKTYGETRPR